MAQTMWDRYGGYSFVAKTVDDFYASVLASDNLLGYFRNVNMEILIGHQIETIGAVMGGPYEVDVEALKSAHRRLKITSDHFNEVAVLLSSALTSNGVNTEDHDSMMGVVASTRDFIVDPAELAA